MSEMSLHAWDVTPKQAMAVQEKLRQRLVLAWDGRAIATVCGVDVSVKDNRSRAAIVALGYPDLEPIRFS